MPVTLADALPYGLRDCKITPYTDASGTTLGSTSYDLARMQTLTFGETEEFEELRGDDKLVTTHGKGAKVEWDLEAGGISLPVWSILSGGNVVESGTTPNRQVVLRKKGSDSRPYFRIDGQIISDSGGDVVARIYRCKCNAKIEGKFGDGTFFVTSVGGIGLPMTDDVNDLLYDIIQNETVSTLTTTPSGNPIAPPSGLVMSSITATGATVTWGAVTGATSYHLQTSDDNGATWSEVSGDVTAPTVTKALTGLTTGKSYWVHVKAIGTANSNYSESKYFKTA
jgi:hypothetical protein